MKSRMAKIAVLFGMTVLTAGMMTGCGEKKEEVANSSKEDNPKIESQVSTPESQNESETEPKPSGAISLSGSTSMQKLADALCESFMEKYPDVTVTAEFTGSGAGIEAVIGGQCDIGNSSRHLKDEEKANGAVENVVAIDGIAVVTDKENTVTGLSKDQLISIYNGTVTNWSELGGTDTPIVVIGREAGSGTRGAFEEILKIEDQCAYANELDSTGAVMAKVSSTPGTIGYVSLDIVDDSVKALALDDVEATVENIKAGSYLLQRPFVMATKGEISEQSELIQAWFEYVMGTEGQDVAAKVGLITVE